MNISSHIKLLYIKRKYNFKEDLSAIGPTYEHGLSTFQSKKTHVRKILKLNQLKNSINTFLEKSRLIFDNYYWLLREIKLIWSIITRNLTNEKNMVLRFSNREWHRAPFNNIFQAQFGLDDRQIMSIWITISSSIDWYLNQSILTTLKEVDSFEKNPTKLVIRMSSWKI